MKIKTLVVSLCLVAMSGCGGCGSSGKTAWTIFVYGNGDHNLSGSLANDIDKMTKATLTGDVRVIVAADYNASEKDASGVQYPTGTTWYSITGGGEKTIIDQTSEQNFDDPEVLSDAVAKVIQNYPADHYGVILWDHGGAWDRGFGGDNQDGTLFPSRGMTAVEARDAIRKGLKTGGSLFNVSPTLDFIGFDTCLLGTAEVAYLFKDMTKVYIANAEIDFGAGWNYTDTLTALAANTSMTPIEFATMEIEKWDILHKDITDMDKLIRSHTAIDTSKINDFATAIKNFVDVVEVTKSNGVLPNNGDVYANALALAVPGYGELSVKKTEDYDYRDLGQFLKYIVTNGSGDVAIKAKAAFDALSAMQIGRDYGTLRDPLTTYELAFNIALPTISSITPDLLSNYATKAEEWTNATGWKNFLADLKFSTSNEIPNGTYTVTGMTGTLIPSGSSLTFATMDVIQYNFPTNYNYGTTHFGKVTAGVTYNMLWDGNIWKLGTQAADTTVIPWSYVSDTLDAATSNPDNLLAAAAIITDNDGSLYNAYFIFEAGKMVAKSVTFQSESGEWAAASVDDFAEEHTGATFRPALMEAEDGFFVAQGTAEDVPLSGGVMLTTASAPHGTYYLIATVQNAWGNYASGGELYPITMP